MDHVIYVILTTNTYEFVHEMDDRDTTYIWQ